MSARAAPGSRPGARFAQFKLVLLGESAVGKSSLVLRFVKDQFDDYRESTIGAAFLTQTISLDDTTTVKFEIWDTAGQERYKSLAPMYYRNANCAVVVYDITQAPKPGSKNSNAKPTKTSSSPSQATNPTSSPPSPTNAPSPPPTPKPTPANPAFCSSKRAPRPQRTSGNSSPRLRGNYPWSRPGRGA
ncbi:MAG: hypothetical protein Q9223_002117 [Gallowayella weberi]